MAAMKTMKAMKAMKATKATKTTKAPKTMKAMKVKNAMKAMKAMNANQGARWTTRAMMPSDFHTLIIPEMTMGEVIDLMTLRHGMTVSDNKRAFAVFRGMPLEHVMRCITRVAIPSFAC